MALAQAFLSSPISSCVSRQVHVRRHLQVVGRGLVLEDAAGQVERRAVARAEEAARPVVGQRRLRRRAANLSMRRAAEVGADADHDQDSGLIERYSFLRTSGCCGDVRIRVGEPGRRASAATRASPCVRRHDPDRLAAPFDVDASRRLELPMSTSTGAPAALARSEGSMLTHERHRRRDAAAPPTTRGRDHQIAPRLVHFYLRRSWRWRVCRAGKTVSSRTKVCRSPFVAIGVSKSVDHRDLRSRTAAEISKRE